MNMQQKREYKPQQQIQNPRQQFQHPQKLQRINQIGDDESNANDEYEDDESDDMANETILNISHETEKSSAFLEGLEDCLA